MGVPLYYEPYKEQNLIKYGTDLSTISVLILLNRSDYKKHICLVLRRSLFQFSGTKYSDLKFFMANHNSCRTTSG